MIAVAFLAGNLTGAVCVWVMHGHLLAEQALESVAGGIARESHSLMLLREGEYVQLQRERQQALDTDVSILALAGLDNDVPDRLVKPLRNALNYYEKYPIDTGDHQTDVAVMEFLSKVGETPQR